ncbi:PAS domain S-box protein [Maribellus sediminis]|uniref:PAS domain S-box protein n=1 Tax=Maribellus sediminis TaxID=2696285 RepID=UPI00142FDD44|nr:PAS domain S-box protein [Maribellus sediminis]
MKKNANKYSPKLPRKLKRVAKKISTLNLLLDESIKEVEQNGLNQIVSGYYGLSGHEFLNFFVSFYAELLEVKFVYIASFDKEFKKLQVKAGIENGEPAETSAIDIYNTPLHKILGKEFYCYTSNTANKFPHYEFLQQNNLEGFAGLPLLNEDQEVIGAIYCYTQQSISKPSKIKSYLQLFSIRISNELYLERKEVLLNASEKKYQTLFETANDTIFLVQNQRFVECNAKAIEMFGCSDKSDIIGKSVIDFSPEKQPDGSSSEEKAQQYISEVEKGIPQRFYWLHKRMDQSVFDAEVTLNPLKIDNTIHFQGIVRDISDQLKNHQNLAESEERFKIIFENAPDAMYLNDLSGHLIYGNLAAEKLIGAPREALVGKNYFEGILAPEDREKALVNLERNARGLKSGPTEYLVNTSEGEKILEITGFPVTINNELVALGIARDITERKKIETELRERDNIIRSIVETSKDWIWAIDLKGVHTYSNDAIEHILGYPKEEVAGTDALRLLHEDDAQKAEHILQESFSKNCGWQNLVLRWKHKDGSVRFLESNSVPVTNEKNEIIGFRGVDRDITERIHVENNLIKAKEIAEENERKLLESQRVARIGHFSLDLKTWIFEISPEISRIFGVIRESAYNVEDFISLVHPEDRDKMSRYLTQEILSKKETRVNEYRIIHKLTGQTIWMRSEGELRIDSANAPIEYFGTVQEITELKTAEIQLLEYNAILEKSKEEILLKNRISNTLILSNEDEFYKSILDIVLETLDCTFGFFGYISGEGEEEKLVCPTLTQGVWGNKQTPEKVVVFPKKSWQGVWGESLKQKKSLFKNKNLEVPMGHLILENALAVPILFHNTLIGQIVLANKAGDFNVEHQQLLEEICNYISPLLQSKLSEEKYKNELIAAREKSEESEMKYKNLADNTPDFIYTFDLKCRHTMVNKAVCIALNRPAEEIIGKNHLDLGFPKAIAKEWQLMHQKVIETGKEYKALTTTPMPGGTIRNYEVMLTPMFDENKQVKGIRGVSRDITAQKKYEDDLLKAIEKSEESETKFRSAFENSGVGMCLVSLSGHFLKINKALTNILGYSEEELLNLTFQEITHPDDLQLDLNLLNETIEGKRTNYFIVKRYMNKSENIVHANLHVSLVRNSKNEPLFFVSQIENITKQKEYELELISAKEKAEESDRLKTAFLLNVSHEIRTPMNGILGFIELLNQPGLNEQERSGFVDIIHKSGDRLMNTINDIVEISKIEIGDITIRQDDVNLLDLMQYYYNFFKLQTEEKGLTLEINQQISDFAAQVKTDKYKLDGILMNLIKNAVKFTDTGKIEIGNYIKDDKLWFYVSDTGKGIPEDRQEAIFDRFVQAEIGLTRGYEGSGIGLSIVKAYVEILNGCIEVKSEPGKGSTFKFCIPYHPTHSTQPLVEVQEQIKTVESPTTILIAEDDEVNCLLLESILAGNYKLLFAKNGTEAVQMYIDHPEITLILMDIKMPGEFDGLEAARRIRKVNTEVPIIAQTAFASDSDKNRSIEAGCCDYIAKPYNASHLKKLIQKYL